MSQYELTILLPKKEEENKIKEILASLKAKILNEETWGEKKLAYPIKKYQSAFYFIYQIEIDKKYVLELRKRLNFEDKIIRFLLLVNKK